MFKIRKLRKINIYLQFGQKGTLPIRNWEIWYI